MAKPSIKTLTAAQDAARNPAEPPTPLLDGARPHFDRMASARASFDWSPADLSLIARMANLTVRCDQMWADAESEGFTVINSKGTEVANPKVGIACELERLILTAGGKMALHGMGAAGIQRDVLGRHGKAEREAKTTADPTLSLLK